MRTTKKKAAMKPRAKKAATKPAPKKRGRKPSIRTVQTKATNLDEQYKPEPEYLTMKEIGLKYDKGKIRLGLMPPLAESQIAAVFTYGADKYDAWNWAKGIASERLLSAALRHIAQFRLGFDTDQESGLHHLAHAGCCIMMLLETNLLALSQDDRPDTYKGMIGNPFEKGE